MRTITNKHCNELNMLALREFVEHEALFDMRTWIAGTYTDDLTKQSACHTAMCIGGSAAWLMALGQGVDPRVYPEFAVSDWLGISEDAGSRLFYCADDNSPRDEVISDKHWYRLLHVKLEHALMALDNILRDGAPHWDVVCKDMDAQYEINRGWDR